VNVNFRNSTVVVCAAATLAFVFGFAYGNLFGLEHTFDLQKWQALVGAAVALLAAVIAFLNTTRSLSHAKQLEDRRRGRKHAAVRATLPLALSQVLDYANRSAHSLNDLIASCRNNVLPPMTAPTSLVQPIPTETLPSLAEFIEYSDTLDVGIVEGTIALIQIHDARVRALVEANRDPSRIAIVRQEEIEGRIVNAASIYAGAAAVFDYARRRADDLPRDITWDAVRACAAKHVVLGRRVSSTRGHDRRPGGKVPRAFG
jgi:hypothetical protein